MVLLAVILITGVHARSEKPEWQTKLPRTLQADFPYTKAAVRQNFPKDTVANKGMAIIAGHEAFMCFDTDLLRWSAGWTGNYLTEDGVSFRGNHGRPRVAGDQNLAAARWPPGGCSGQLCRSAQGTFGLLPGRSQWRGCYVADDTVVLSYTVGDVQFLEQPVCGAGRSNALCAACNTAR